MNKWEALMEAFQDIKEGIEAPILEWETVKTVPLDKEQMTMLDNAFFIRRESKEIVSKIMSQVIEECAKRQRDTWDNIAEMCGYASTAAMEADGLTMNISWLERIIRVQRRKEISAREACLSALQTAKEYLVAEADFDLASKVKDIADELKKKEMP
jgi:hypothetical protein